MIGNGPGTKIEGPRDNSLNMAPQQLVLVGPAETRHVLRKCKFLKIRQIIGKKLFFTYKNFNFV